MAEPALIANFALAPLRYRRDGWTPQCQAAFFRALAERGSVSEACKRVGRSRSSAYALYHHPAAAGFRRAWDAAAAIGVAKRRAARRQARSGTSRRLLPPGIEPGRHALLLAPAEGWKEGSYDPSTSSTLSTSAGPPEHEPVAIPLPGRTIVRPCAGGDPFTRISRTIRWRGRRGAPAP